MPRRQMSPDTSCIQEEEEEWEGVRRRKEEEEGQGLPHWECRRRRRITEVIAANSDSTAQNKKILDRILDRITFTVD